MDEPLRLFDVPDEVCRWFALCGRPATTTTAHPVLGELPTCQSCHELAAGR